MLNEKEAMSQPAKAAPTPTNCKAIVRGRTFNHRDGMSELKKFEEDLAMPTPQSLEFPLSLSNHPVSNEKVVLHDADGMRIAIFELESEAAYVFRAVNAHAALQAENAELRNVLKTGIGIVETTGVAPFWIKCAKQLLTRPPEARP